VVAGVFDFSGSIQKHSKVGVMSYSGSIGRQQGGWEMQMQQSK
jgi:hypothetical protein